MTAPAAPAPPGPVLFDLTGTQSPDHRSRGIGRYVAELAAALEAVAPDRVGAYLTNPDLPLPAGIEPLVASGKLGPADEALFGQQSVLHIASPYELSVAMRRLWPEAARRAGAALVVTLYDLIPEALADRYLADSGFRDRYRARHELVRAADAVLALSEATARDGVTYLGLDPGRITVVGAGVSPRFAATGAPGRPPPVDGLTPPVVAPGRPPPVDGLKPPFVLYTGGAEPRKNVDGLLAAWARLPERLRRTHQLVVVCGLSPSERNHLAVVAARAGVAGSLLLTGYVDDATLAGLYRSTELFVFPSRYEGYGLPVAEALACGAPAIAANRSCLPELLPPAALFDPDDPRAIAAAITAALDDTPTRAALLAATGRAPHTWADVATATAAVYDQLARSRQRSARASAAESGAAAGPGAAGPGAAGPGAAGPGAAGPGAAAPDTDESDAAGTDTAGTEPIRPRIAFVCPAPQAAAVDALRAELQRLADVTTFADGPITSDVAAPEIGLERPAQVTTSIDGPTGPLGSEGRSLTALEEDSLAEPFDAVVYCLGNDEGHAWVLPILRRRPGIVVAHDARFTDLYAGAERESGAFSAALHAQYPSLPDDVGAGGRLPAGEARHYGVLMAGEIIAASTQFLAPSATAAALARLDAAPADRHKIAVLPGDPAATAQLVARAPGHPAAIAEPVAPEPGHAATAEPVAPAPGDGAATADRAASTPGEPAAASRLVTAAPVEKAAGAAARTRHRAEPRPVRPGQVLFDLTGAQNPQFRGRGISRYVSELAAALEGAEPDRIGAFLVNPDLPLPAGAEELAGTGKLIPADEVTFGPEGILHVPSPYELAVPLRRLWPEAARRAGTALVVTLHDLIPEVLIDDYLADPGTRQRYRARHQLVRLADAVVAVSQATARDGVERLGLNPSRMHVIGEGTSAPFRVNGAAQATVAPGRPGWRPFPVDGLRAPFVLYTGGADPRKNVDGLLAAWALLPERLRRTRQLVVVCALSPSERNHLEVLAAKAGIAGDVLFAGYVDDATLAGLYRDTELFVFPSRYEGYGLPVAEALACGAPVVAANRSCLPELLPAAALFDPDDPHDMAATITAALDDTPTRAALLAATGRAPHTWAEVAAATAAVYDRVAEVTRPARRAVKPDVATERQTGTTGPRRRAAAAGAGGRRRIAFVSPMPPQPSGVADYSALLLEAMAPLADVTVFVDGPPHHRAEQRRTITPAGIEHHRVAGLEQAEAIGGPYDAVIYSLGNSEFHTGALAALFRRPGIVLAHDVRLTNLYRFAPHQHPRALAARGPDAFHATLQAMYPHLPPEVGSGGEVSSAEADHHGILMARDVLAACTRFVATSAYAATLARLDARPADRPKIGVVPLAIGVHAAVPLPAGAAGAAEPTGPPLVASYGLVNARKQTGTLLAAFAIVAAAHPDARLAIVGPAGEAEVAALRARIADFGLAGRVELTGRVDPEEYGAWLQRTTVAVQLRDDTNGETSGAVGACLASGVPTVVTAIGPARELPPGSVVPVPPFAPPEQVAAATLDLLARPDERRALARAAQAHAADRSFERTARRLVDLVDRLTPIDRAGPPGR